MQLKATPGALHERDRELARLTDAIAAAHAGNGSTVAIEAPAGLGKSRLIAWAVDHAASTGMQTFVASADEHERGLSFGVAIQLFARWLASASTPERAAALAGPAQLAAPVLEGRHLDAPALGSLASADALAHGLFWFVVNRTESSPILLAIDDMQWSDPASARFLLYLARRIHDLPVVLVLARRTGDVSTREDVVRDLLARAEAPLTPGPLREQAVSMILEQAFGATPDAAFACACRDATGGNPFLVHAITRALAEEQLEPIADNVARIEALHPREIGHWLHKTLTRLGPDADQLARAAAVLGDRSLLASTRRLAGLEPDAASVAADALVDSGILATVLPVTFAHPLVRGALYQGLPAARRNRMHIRAAEFYQLDHAPAEVVSAQLVQAWRVGEPWAIDALRRAARTAADAGNPDSAVRYLERALLEPLEPAARAEVLLELADAELAVGSELAEQHVEQALTLVERDDSRARAYQALGDVRRTRGDLTGATTAYGQGLRIVGDADSLLARNLHAGYYTTASRSTALAPQAFEHLAPLLERAPGGETATERTALAALAVFHAVSGAPREQAIALAMRAWGDGALLEDEGPEGTAWSLVTGTLTWTDEHDASLAVANAVIDRARECGAAMAYATACLCAFLPALYTGRVNEARSHGDAIADAMRVGWNMYPLPYAANAARTFIVLDDLAAASHVLGLLDREHGQDLDQSMALTVRGDLLLLEGRDQEALDTFGSVRDMCELFHAANPYVGAWRTGAATALHRLGRPDEALELLDAAGREAERSGIPTYRASVCAVRGQMAGADERVVLLEQACACLDGSSARLPRLGHALELGVALRVAGHKVRAREVLEATFDEAQRYAAHRIARLAHEELRIVGARPRRLRFSGPAALTASERRVAELAASGKGNREIAQMLFLSPRTVEQHLYHAYRKLDIGSRAALAAALEDS